MADRWPTIEVANPYRWDDSVDLSGVPHGPAYDKALWISDQPDACSCECRAACNERGAGIGIVLTGDEDAAVWRVFWLVWIDGVVVAMCEDCMIAHEDDEDPLPAHEHHPLVMVA
jgi:hypothetical protein